MGSSKNSDLQKLPRMDQIWEAGIRLTMNSAKGIISAAFEHTRKWAIMFMGVSGIGKSWIFEEVANSLGIGFVKLTATGLAPEDLRGFPQIVKVLKLGTEYPRNVAGLVTMLRDYLGEEPVYKMVLLETLRKVFDPRFKGIFFIDEWAQASKEVQDVLFQVIYDRRIDDNILPDGVLVVSAMNPPNLNEYMLNKISKAAEDRMEIYVLDPTASEWIIWAKEFGIDNRLISFISEHPGVYDLNKGRRLHHFSDKLSMFKSVKPNDHKTIKLIKTYAHATIDIESGDMFVKHLKDMFEISGISLLLGDEKTMNRLESMMESQEKAVHLSRIFKEVIAGIEDPENHLKDIWTKNKKVVDRWKVVAVNIMRFLRVLQSDSLDSAVSLAKSVIDLGIVKLSDELDRLFRLPENKKLAEGVMECAGKKRQSTEKAQEETQMEMGST